jgi:hypothetical protein
MRKILVSLIVLLAASLASSGAPPDRLPSLVAPAQAGGIMLIQQGVPAVSNLNTVNISRGFEVDSQPTNWTDTWTSRYSTAQYRGGGHSALAQKTADASTTAEGKYTNGTGVTPTSLCAWIRPTFTADGTVQVIGVGSDSDWAIVVRIQKNTGVLTIAGTGITGTIDISAYESTWIRFELLAVKAGTSTLYVYDAAGNAIGNLSGTAANQALKYLHFGLFEATGTARCTLYYDDIGADWTDATTPLWEYTVDN